MQGGHLVLHIYIFCSVIGQQHNQIYASRENLQVMTTSRPSMNTSGMESPTSGDDRQTANVVQIGSSRSTEDNPASAPNPLNNITQSYPTRQGFCVALRDENGFNGQIYISCYCDEYCGIFDDCCSAAQLECKNTDETPNRSFQRLPSSPSLSIGPNDVECRSQSSKEFSSRVVTMTRKYTWMVVSCPSNWPNNTIRERCERPSKSIVEVDTHFPVTDPESELTFQNSNCARCHGLSHYVPWSTSVVCVSTNLEDFASMSNMTGVFNVVKNAPDCFLYYQEPEGFMGRPCVGGRFNRHVLGAQWYGGATHCRPESPYKEPCKDSKYAITRVIPGHNAVTYAKSHFCWLCVFDEAPVVVECATDVDSVLREFAPLGFYAFIDPHKQDSTKSCQPNKNLIACLGRRDGDDCPNPFSFLFNTLYTLTIALRFPSSANVAQTLTECRSFAASVFARDEGPLNLLELYYGNWEIYKFKQPECYFLNITALSGEQNKEFTNATMFQTSIPIMLTKFVRNYNEGFRMLLQLEAKIAANKPTIAYNGTEVPIYVIRNSQLEECLNDNPTEQKEASPAASVTTRPPMSGSASTEASVCTGWFFVLALVLSWLYNMA